MNSKTIAFFYPSNKIGGAQLLFARLMVYFVINNHDVMIIDYSDGFLRKYAQDNNVNPRFVEFTDLPVRINDDICLIQHLSSIISIKDNLILSEESTLVFWSIHPHNVLALMNLTPVYTRVSYALSKFLSTCFEPLRKAKVIELLENLNSKKALYYMDESNLFPSKDIGLLNTSAKFIPIPILGSKMRKARSDYKISHIAWIGRITDEKIYPFEFIVSGLDQMARSHNIVFHVIGYGKLDSLRATEYLKYKLHGVVNENELDRILLNEVDCVFAMGTSVLEAAKLRIPAVLVDVSKTPFPRDYKFKWLFQTTGYSLGTQASSSNGSIAFRDVMDVLYNRLEYEEVANFCLDYSNEFHNIDSVGQQIILACNSSTYTFRDINQTSMYANS